MMPTTSILPLLFFCLFILGGIQRRNLAKAAGGRWDLLQRSIGISAMHMQLLSNDRVIIFDRTDFGLSNLSLPDGKCRDDPNETVVKVDCTAHSAEYDVATNSVRPLMILTDTWCSSGAVFSDGRLVQTGGFNDGDRAVRTIRPCDSCDWEEIQTELSARRWYATNQILPDGRAIIVGGRRQFSYEFYPKSNGASGVTLLPFLRQTSDAEENNLYPFVHLNIDGNLFIFANNRAILLDYSRNTVVRTYPPMPGSDPRNYPSSGSSVLLPLKISQSSAVAEAEVLICGGAPTGSYIQASRRNFIGALNTCGRIKITDKSPEWTLETMPSARVMGDMVLLPTGEVLIINGAAAGSAGWELGRNPVLSPVIYKPDNAPSSRFEVQNPSTIPRLYHSTAILLRDGRVLVGGSNPHVFYNFTGVLYPTELSLEAFLPSYLNSGFSGFRPNIISPSSPAKLSYGQKFTIQFHIGGGLSRRGVSVSMVAPPFATHSFSMNQRLLFLATGAVRKASAASTYEVDVVAPNSGVLAPSGYYLLFVVNAVIPSGGIWVHIQ